MSSSSPGFKLTVYNLSLKVLEWILVCTICLSLLLEWVLLNYMIDNVVEGVFFPEVLSPHT
jgi:hypothetical protein